MRKSRAVTGEAAAAPSAAAPAGGAGSAGAVGEARTSFDGTLYVLYGGEAATQVAAELADGARRAGLAPQLVAAADFRNLKLERCAWRPGGAPSSFAAPCADVGCVSYFSLPLQRAARGVVCG